MDMYHVAAYRDPNPISQLNGYEMNWLVMAHSKAHAKALVHEQYGLDDFDHTEVTLDGRTVIPMPNE